MKGNSDSKRNTKKQLRGKVFAIVLMYMLSCMPVPYLEAISVQTVAAEVAGQADTDTGSTTGTDTGTTTGTETGSTSGTDTGSTTGTDTGSTTGTDTGSTTGADTGSTTGTDTGSTTGTDTGSTTGTDTGSTTSTETTGTTASAGSSKFNTKIKKLSGGKFIKKGKWYYYRKKNGKLAVNGLYKIRKKIYYLDSKGRRRFGWKKIDGVKYYFGKSKQGYMYRGKWATIKGKRYYFTENGETLKGWQVIGGKQYYFKKGGYVCTTSKKKDGVRCYFNSNGEVCQIGSSISVASPCALIMEVKSGKIIYAKNPDLAHANASTTKIMTAILALEKAKLTDTVKVSAYAASMEPTKLGMVAGDSFKLEDLLYSLLVASGNDTAVALAEHVSGTVTKFVAKMNKRAAALGCTNTHFATPNGLDAGRTHYTTARDLAIMARHALNFSKFRQIVQTASYSIRSYQGRYYSVGTTNALLNNMAYVKGIKTGFTRKAGYCFVGLITGKNGKEYITVDLGASNSAQRWSDARTLLAYAYTRG